MAPEHPPAVVIFDSHLVEGELKGSVQYVEPTGVGARLRVRWGGEIPTGFESMGDGVACFRSDSPVAIVPANENASADDLGEGLYRFVEGLNPGIPWVMFILVIPAGHTISESTPAPEGAREFKGRLALYWMLRGDDIGRTEVQWRLTPWRKDARHELMLLHRLCAEPQQIERANIAVEAEKPEEPTRLARWQYWMENNRWIAAGILAGIIVVAIASFTDAVKSISSLFGSEEADISSLNELKIENLLQANRGNIEAEVLELRCLDLVFVFLGGKQRVSGLDIYCIEEIRRGHGRQPIDERSIKLSEFAPQVNGRLIALLTPSIDGKNLPEGTTRLEHLYVTARGVAQRERQRMAALQAGASETRVFEQFATAAASIKETYQSPPDTTPPKIVIPIGDGLYKTVSYWSGGARSRTSWCQPELAPIKDMTIVGATDTKSFDSRRWGERRPSNPRGCAPSGHCDSHNEYCVTYYRQAGCYISDNWLLWYRETLRKAGLPEREDDICRLPKEEPAGPGPASK